ncbi:MAG: CopG family ribbon-helix-helix protein [Candidatus Hodarchaeota archaeon]
MPIVSISIPEKLLEDLEESLQERGFASRSEIIRQALRDFIMEHKDLEKFEGEIIATITIVYEKSAQKVKTLDIQHQYGSLISTFLHAHVDSSNCLEVMVVRGEAVMIRELIDSLKTSKLIQQVKVVFLGKPS